MSDFVPSNPYIHQENQQDRPGPTVWVGTTVDASHYASAEAGHIPVLAVWFDISDAEEGVLATVRPGFREDATPPLVEALREFVTAGGDPADLPTEIRGATPEDVAVLRQNAVEGISLADEPMPEFVDWAEQVLEEFVQAMERENPPGGEA